MTVDLNLPPEMDEATLTTVWRTVHTEAKELGIAIVGGHTARYAGCNFPMVGGATVFGVGPASDLVDPRKAQPGDVIVITKGPAIETTGLMAVQFPEFIAERWDEQVAREARDVYYQMSVVRDAAICARCGGVTAMHDATECGVWGALFEIARASRTGLIVDKRKIVTQDVVLKVCEVFDIDPFSSISEGTLVATMKPESADRAIAALFANGIPASVVGELLPPEKGVMVIDESGQRALEHPRVDPFWGRFEEYLVKQKAAKEGRGRLPAGGAV